MRSTNESTLNRLFDEQQLNFNDLECRGETCRVELSSSGKNKAHEDMSKFILSLPNASGHYNVETLADGSENVVLLVRP